MLKTETISQITLPTPYPVGDVHVYLLKGDTLSLIDAGVNTDEAWNIFKQQLKDLGFHPSDIEQIILTHHHPDHTGLVGRFDHDPKVYGHSLNHLWLTKDQDYFAFYVRFFEETYKEFAVPEEYFYLLKILKESLKYGGSGYLTNALSEGDELPGHPGWKVIETPGHAMSQLSFYHEENHSFFAGDVILQHISPNPLIEPPLKEGLPRPKPLILQRESLMKLANYPIQKVYPGHGPIFTGVKTLIKERLEKQERRAEKVYRFLEKESLTVFEVCKQLFPSKYDTQLGLTMSETVGQLDYLESIGKVKKEKQSGYYVYSVNQ
jgi:glyoxylase-like metal-dependent hydrolase (beta-lactamase superfamily II)